MISSNAPLALVVGALRPRGKQIVEQLRADGFVVTTDEAQVLALMDAAHSLDLLVVNSPVFRSAIRFRELTDDDFLAVLETQLYDLVSAGQFAASHMRGGGAIVHVTAASHLGSWDGVHSAAGVAGAIAMVRSMSLELGPLGIRVNSLAPDTIEAIDELPADAGEVAATVGWLASPASGLVTGEAILLNQGRSLKMAQAARR